MQFGDHEYIRTLSIIFPSRITKFPIQNAVPKREAHTGGGSMDPAVADLFAKNRLMEKWIADLNQLFVGLV